MKFRCGVFGVSGLQLTQGEKDFFSRYRPLGLILFQRNCESLSQINELVESFRKAVKWSHAPVLIDEEGGKVQRIIVEPNKRRHPPFSYFGELYQQNREKAESELRDNISEIADKLKICGINLVCSPVLDIFYENSSNIIGTRSFSAEPEVVTSLGEVVVDQFLADGIVPIIKHIPGHGRAEFDSHKRISQIGTTLEELEKSDFIPFKALVKAPLAMTAHLIYKEIDPTLPVSVSTEAINFIRTKLGFQGLIITDCIHMNALHGSHPERAKAALEAGVDIVLNSHGKPSAMEKVAQKIPFVDFNSAPFKTLFSLLENPGSSVLV